MVLVRRNWLLAILAVIGIAALVSVITYYLREEGLATAANVAQLVSIPLAALPIVAGLLIWARKTTVSMPPLSIGQMEQLRECLTSKIQSQWERETSRRLLGDPFPIPIEWRFIDGSIADHSWLSRTLTGQASHRGGRIRDIEKEYDRLSRRRLVILGPPGSGKTTLAIRLLLWISSHSDSADRVPVFLSLSSWDMKKYPDLWDWIANRIEDEYPAVRSFGPNASQSLVDRRMVLPVLDGLDEVAEVSRPDIISSLNASLAHDDPLIITCRTSEYEQAVLNSDVLTAAAVIEPDPILPSVAANYLEACTPPGASEWREVLASLRSGEADELAEVSMTALGLWLIRTVYIQTRRSPKDLVDSKLFPDAAALRTYLLNHLIAATLAFRHPSASARQAMMPAREWDPRDVQSWLSYLARLLDRADSTEFLWWHLARNTFTGHSFGIRLGISFGCIAGVAFGLAGGILLGLLGAFGFGVAGLLVGKLGCSIHMNPWYSNLRLHGKVKVLGHAAVRGLILGGTGGIAAGLLFQLTSPSIATLIDTGVGREDHSLPHGVIFGAVIGVTFFTMFTIAEWTQMPVPSDDARSPASTLKGDRAAVLSRLAVPMVVLSVSFTIILGSVSAGLAFGLLCALGAWIPASGAWFIYILAARRLALAGRLPWRLQDFLHDCYQVGLLRTVGAAYVFRHAELQEHLVLPGSSQMSTQPARRRRSTR